MEVGVAVPARMEERPRLLVHRRVVRFDAKVESQQEVGEVQTDAGSVGEI